VKESKSMECDNCSALKRCYRGVEYNKLNESQKKIMQNTTACHGKQLHGAVIILIKTIIDELKLFLHK
jgi:sulfatase maturation enzyme AslB (radical SAM superfamily)